MREKNALKNLEIKLHSWSLIIIIKSTHSQWDRLGVPRKDTILGWQVESLANRLEVPSKVDITLKEAVLESAAQR